METIKIQQTTYEPALEKLLMHELNSAAIKATGIDGWDPERIVFSARSGEDIIGAIVVQIIYSQLHIEYMLVLDKHRNQGIGSRLMQTALKYGKDNACTFAYLETLSFQAPEFYEKMGFKREFSRAGFAGGVLFHYYRREI